MLVHVVVLILVSPGPPATTKALSEPKEPEPALNPEAKPAEPDVVLVHTVPGLKRHNEASQQNRTRSSGSETFLVWVLLELFVCHRVVTLQNLRNFSPTRRQRKSLFILFLFSSVQSGAGTGPPGLFQNPAGSFGPSLIDVIG